MDFLCMVLRAFGLVLFRRETRCLFLMRTSEMLAVSEERVSALFRGSWPSWDGHCGIVQTGLNCIFRCSKNYQFRQGAFVARVFTSHTVLVLLFGGGGGMQLMSAHIHLFPDALLVSYTGYGGGLWGRKRKPPRRCARSLRSRTCSHKQLRYIPCALAARLDFR